MLGRGERWKRVKEVVRSAASRFSRGSGRGRGPCGFSQGEGGRRGGAALLSSILRSGYRRMFGGGWRGVCMRTWKRCYDGWETEGKVSSLVDGRVALYPSSLECPAFMVICRAAPPPRDRAAKTSLFIQKVFDCKMVSPKPLLIRVQSIQGKRQPPYKGRPSIRAIPHFTIWTADLLARVHVPEKLSPST
jgi:hypothetical protein